MIECMFLRCGVGVRVAPSPCGWTEQIAGHKITFRLLK